MPRGDLARRLIIGKRDPSLLALMMVPMKRESTLTMRDDDDKHRVISSTRLVRFELKFRNFSVVAPIDIPLSTASIEPSSSSS